jgi:hypothetical protein
MGSAWRTLGRVAAALGHDRGAQDPDGAEPAPRACFEESLRVFRQMNAEGEQARTLRAWAQYEVQQRHAAPGEKMWHEARDLFLRLGLSAEVQKMDTMQAEKAA